MDLCVVLFCVIWTLFVVPSYTKPCSCTNGSNVTLIKCPRFVGYTNICYRRWDEKVCVKITCSDALPYEAWCRDKDAGVHGSWTWSTGHVPSPSNCNKVTTTPPPTTTRPSSPVTKNDSSAGNTTTNKDGTTTAFSATTATSNDTQDNTTTAATQNSTTTTIAETTKTPTIPPTSSNSSFTNTAKTESPGSSTTTEDNVTSETGAASQDDNTVIYASASAGIVIVIIVIVIMVVFLMRRRKTQKDESNGIKRQPHGAISNNSYHNAAMNGNNIPMNDLTRTASENRYTDIYDDKAMAIDTFDGNYNTVSLPNEPKNEYGNIKPVAEPFVDNTYSHISNPNHLNMGTMYSHIGSALGHQKEKQPDFVGDTYAHIGQGNGNVAAKGKNKQDTFVSDDTYSHIGKDATVPKTTKKTAEVDDTYSHLGQNVNQHPKMPPNADADATYNTLGASTNGVGTQNRPNQLGDDNDDDSEYNHLEFGMKSATKQNQFPRKQNITKLPDKNTKQNTAASNLYAQVVKKKHGKFGVEAGSKATDKAKANTDNEQGQHNKFVVKENDAKIAEGTENEPTNHQYFVLEKHERET